MAEVEQITLYTAKICPFAHRVELALEEAGVEYTRCEIDLSNKPQWYAPQVNPASKVPAIAYGGPPVPPTQPSPLSTKLAESLILVEFLADLFPTSSLLPKSPVARARTRFFIDAVSTQFLPAYMAPLARGAPFPPFYTALEGIQALLPPDSAEKGFAVEGAEFGAADIALLPFLARMEVALRNDIGAYKEGEGLKAAKYIFEEEAREGGRFERLVRYFERVKARESFKKTFDADLIKEKYSARFAVMRQQVQAAAAAEAKA